MERKRRKEGRGNVAGVNQTQVKATRTMERKRRKEVKRSLWQKVILVQKPRRGERSENKRCPLKIRMTIDQRRRTRRIKSRNLHLISTRKTLLQPLVDEQGE